MFAALYLSDALIVLQNAPLQMLEFAGVLRRLVWRLVLPDALSAKSAIPDNRSYQECDSPRNVKT
jgi:hypothetical protein